MRLKNFSLALVLSLVASASFAEEVWKCEIPSHKPTSFLGGPLVFTLSDDGTSGVVSSGMIIHFNKKPMDIIIGKNTDKVLRARWAIRKIKTKKGAIVPSMRYSMVMQKTNGALSYYARSPQYDDSLGASGKCARLR